MKKRIDLFKSNLKSVYEAYKSNLSNKSEMSAIVKAFNAFSEVFEVDFCSEIDFLPLFPSIVSLQKK